jgi:hypothetical protein
VNVGRAAYETSHASLLELLEDQRALIALDRLVADLRITREKHLAELESITTSDLAIPPDTRTKAVPQ